MKTKGSVGIAVIVMLMLWAGGASARERVYYFHNDHLGTPQTMTDQSGTVVWQAAYEPFGKATLGTATITNNLRFPGQYYDAETGLHYNWHRDYDPTTGRYLQPDPAGAVSRFIAVTQGAKASVCEAIDGQEVLGDQEYDGALGEFSGTLDFADATMAGDAMLDAADLNMYGYTLQNPIMYVDPTGENPAAAGRAAQAAAIALRMARAGAVAAWGFCKSIQCKVKIHPDHHYFGPPFNRKMRHVQATCWRKGVKGSTINIRIPIP